MGTARGRASYMVEGTKTAGAQSRHDSKLDRIGILYAIPSIEPVPTPTTVNRTLQEVPTRVKFEKGTSPGDTLPYLVLR